MTKLICSRCIFWDSTSSMPVHDLGDASECKRYPPVLEVRECAIDVERIKDIGHLTDPSRFSRPVVWHDDWCGEFQRKTKRTK